MKYEILEFGNLRILEVENLEICQFENKAVTPDGPENPAIEGCRYTQWKASGRRSLCKYLPPLRS